MNGLMSRGDRERSIITGAAEIDACFAALPVAGRETLYRLIDTDVGQLLDLLEAELKLFRQGRLEVDHA